VSRFNSRIAAFVASLAVALASSGCDLGTVEVPATTPEVVVHAVLNPGATSQIMLLERTLTGATTVPDTSFDPNNPITTAGGIPISGAVAEISDSTGRTFRAIEDKVAATGTGTGVYRFPLVGSSLRLGARYQLHVHTLDGEDLTAFTRLPNPSTTSNGSLTRTLNRDHDTLNVRWPASSLARTYAVRVESPFGPFFLFTDSTAVRITGDTRNFFANNLQRVFIPGFRQDMFVLAVDSNFYDYYRTNNDPFTGAGIINRINGGLGLFGSIATLMSGTLSVTADQTEAIEGRFRLTPNVTNPAPPANTIVLYVESTSSRADVPDALSGRYVSTTRNDGIIGQRTGNIISFALLANQLSGDTLDVFNGELQGTTLTGSYRKAGGPVVFVKQ
jgi:hypothetical protein